MKTVCIYHTRSGISKQIALQIAETVGAEETEVTNGKDYKGVFGYISAALSCLKRFCEILPCKTALPIEEYDKIIFVAPVWCENVSPVMRSFLAQNKNRFNGKIYFVCDHMSGISYKRKIDALTDLTGKPFEKILEVKTRKHDWKTEVAEFAENLKE